LAASKSKAPAKAGQIAPTDIMIPAGPTQFTPGPIISELAQVGIKTKVEEGKLSVIADVKFVKSGEKITPKQADMLARFGIEPMEVGLNIVLVYENGTIYDRSLLEIDEESYMNSLRSAISESMALSIEIGYIASENVTLLISKAHRDTLALVESTDIMTEDKAARMLGQANMQMEAVKKLAHLEG